MNQHDINIYLKRIEELEVALAETERLWRVEVEKRKYFSYLAQKKSLREGYSLI